MDMKQENMMAKNDMVHLQKLILDSMGIIKIWCCVVQESLWEI